MQKHGGVSAHFSTLACRAENFRSSNLHIGSHALNIFNHVLNTQDMFTNTKGDKNDIYPPTVTETAQAQKRDPKLKGFFKKYPKLIKICH